ncbi:MAG TPA: acyl-CoA carboxylase subunit beta, partial [Anaerolineaceae bacterium]|nr:acyl-CoA carboxylase subunit beta [Anaerolineaceae bacterium]
MPQEDPRIIELRTLREKARLGGGEDKIAKQHAKGKLTARERIDILLDPGTFVEINRFVVSRLEESSDSYGDGVVTGYGLVNGRRVYVYAQDFTYQGGALGEMQANKITRVLDLAVKSGAPVVGLIDSGGARIQEGIHSLNGYGEIFRRNVQASGIVPQLSVIMGPCAGGAAYSPALTDMIIMVENASYMFLTGPEVIKSVTGEEVDMETLGGAATHLGISGLAHLTAPGEKPALDLVRAVLSYLPENNVENPPIMACDDDPERADEELNSIVPVDWTTPYSMHDVINHIVDRGSFLELQATFATNAVIGFARMNGQPVGIVGNEPSSLGGAMEMNAGDKIGRFVRMCDNFNLPIITFTDTPGFLPGMDQEHNGVIRHGAKVLFAYAEATVPKIGIITRKAYGGAYIVMSSRSMESDMNFAWPSAEIAVMGPEGAANILYRKQIAAAADPKAERARLVQEYRQKFLNPYATASMGYLDDVIEPKETRAR